MSSPGSDRRPGAQECARFQAMALDRYYGELDPAASELLTLHQSVCGDCKRASSEWERVGGWLTEVGPVEATGVSRSLPVGAASLGLGALAMMASLAPMWLLGSDVRVGPRTMGISAVLFMAAYQVVFAGLLAEHSRKRLPVDVRTVLLGLLCCEAALVASASLLLGLPVLDWRLAESVRLSLPDLLTSLSGSILLAAGAWLGLRCRAHSAANALAVATLHALLLVPSRLLIQPAGQYSAMGVAAAPAGLLGTIGFLVCCAGMGLLLGKLGAQADRARLSGQLWTAEPA
ncbi:MAG: hypothetical protein HY816_11330 [Candidatus Wallbacteria bacterium]|nr:hypothetical protein [Candidatus Wallbacteria bacterium]